MDDSDTITAWSLLVTAHDRIMKELATELKRDFALTIPQYDVLLRLVLAPDNRLTMTELATVLLYSSGAATKVIDRLVARDIVTRVPIAGDRRVVCVELTDAGLDLIRRARRDVVALVRDAKAHFARPRPHLGNDAPLCVDRSEALDRSLSYPSGHATEGWTVGLVLAALMPERATALMRRGRTYGESRIVCGVHWASDVEAGRLASSALFAVLVGDPAFRADLDRARSELAAVPPGAAPEPAACTREEATWP